MSNDTQKADQIAFHFYTKLFYVVNHARATLEPGSTSKVDKWFNLETPDSDLFTKDSRDRWKSISSLPSIPPLEIQVLLTIPDLNANKVLVHLPSPESTTRTHVEPTPRYVLLEKWVLEFQRGSRGPDESDSSVALPTIYKNGIPLFRSLFSLLRVLPAWKVAKRLKRRGMGSGTGMSILLRVVEADEEADVKDILGFGGASSFRTSTHTFPSIPHPLGTLNLSSTYLLHPVFRIDEKESLFSSGFREKEREELERERERDRTLDFVPTLVKNQQRDSLISTQSGSIGVGGGAGPSVPRSPPRDIPRYHQYQQSLQGRLGREDAESIAERFVLPSSSSTSSSSHAPTTSTATRAPRTRTTSTLSNMSVSPPRDITTTTSTSRPGSISSRPAFPALLPPSSSSSSFSRSPPRTNAPLPLPLQRSPPRTNMPLPPLHPVSMPVTRAPSTVGGGTGLGLIIGEGQSQTGGQLARLRKESQGPTTRSDSVVPTISGLGLSGTGVSFPTLPPSSTSSTSLSSSPRSRPPMSVNPFKSGTLLESKAAGSGSGSGTTTGTATAAGTAGTAGAGGLSLLRTQGGLGLGSPVSPIGRPGSPSTGGGGSPRSVSYAYGSTTGAGAGISTSAGDRDREGELAERDRRRTSTESTGLAPGPGSSVGSTGGGIAIPNTRKRYSSSFGHRYASAASGASGSPASTGAGQQVQAPGQGQGGSIGSDGSGGVGVVPGSLGRGGGQVTVGRSGSLRSLKSTEERHGEEGGAGSVRSTHPLSQETTHTHTHPLSRPSSNPASSRPSSRPPPSHSPSLPPISTTSHSRPGSASPSRPSSRASLNAPRSASASFLSTRTDDDDISKFVMDIDRSMRRPLVGRDSGSGGSPAGMIGPSTGGRMPLGAAGGMGHRRGYSESEAGASALGSDHGYREYREETMVASPEGITTTTSPTAAAPSSGTTTATTTATTAAVTAASPPGSTPMLTSQSEVDEKLRKMNEAFLASLEGLGSGMGSMRTRRNEGSSGGGGDSPTSTRSARSQGSTSSGASTVRAMGSTQGTITGVTNTGTSGSTRPRIPSLLSGGGDPSYAYGPSSGSGRGSPLTPQSQSQSQSQMASGTSSALGSGSGSGGSSGQGSQEVIGRLELGPSSAGSSSVGATTGQGQGQGQGQGSGLREELIPGTGLVSRRSQFGHGGI